MAVETIKLGLAGATGRMGKTLLDCLVSYPVLSLRAATASSSHPLLGKPIYQDVVLESRAESLFEKADVIIDFSAPESLSDYLDLAVRYQKPMVIGTTGLHEGHRSYLHDAAKHTAILYSANMSLGITLMKRVVSTLTAAFGEGYDVEISETHHRYKVDTPSGTSLMLGEAIAQTRGVSLNDVARFERYGSIGPRRQGEIGFSVQRGGHSLCEHTLRFLGDEETLEITHRGNSRSVYANGALKAACWIFGKSPGFYDMECVLGLKKADSI